MEIKRKQNLDSSKVNQSAAGKKKNASFYYLQGIQNYKEGNKKDAERDFSDGITANENDAIAYFNRGTFYLREKRYKEGIDDFLKAVKLNPKFAEAYYNLACCYVQILSFREGISCLKKAVKHEQIFAQLAEKDPDFFNVNRMKEFKEALMSI
ncbi:MAG: tetratricopeptide repeat protein [Candidatus Sericytochromatia bacterium]